MLKTHLLKKLSSTFTLLIVICCLFINIVAFQIVYYKENNAFKTAIVSLDHTISNEFSDVEATTFNITEQIYTNSFLYDLLLAYSTKDFAEYETYRLESYLQNNIPSSTSLWDSIHMFFSSSPSIVSITLYSPILNRITLFNRNKNIHSTYLSKPLNEDYTTYVLDTLRSKSISSFPYYKQIALKSTESNTNLGYMIIEYRLPSIEDLSSHTPYLAIPKIESNLTTPVTQDTPFVLTFPWDDKNLALNIYFSTKTLQSSLFNFLCLNMLLSLFIIGILLALFNIFFRKMDLLFISILELIHKNQEGDLSHRIKVKEDPSNELTVIANQLNQMNKQLDLYIKTVYVAEAKQKQAHILALQNQVNPHFLYNTLEVIRMQALKEGNRAIGNQISHLSRLHRNLVKGESHIPLRKELEFCRSYIEIQKIRYQDTFEYDITYDKQITSYLVPKFILQPIVENYFKYSLDSNISTNRLTIQASQIDDSVQITITNLGQTVLPDTLSHIHHILSNEISTDSIGLRNTQERIQLEYGESYGISIELTTPSTLVFILNLPSTGLLCLDREKHLI